MTSLSQIDGHDLSQRLEAASQSMSELECDFFLPKTRTEFAKLFHKPMSAAIASDSEAIAERARSFGISVTS